MKKQDTQKQKERREQFAALLSTDLVVVTGGVSPSKLLCW